jgi:hypothetical protein
MGLEDIGTVCTSILYSNIGEGKEFKMVGRRLLY